MRIAYASDLHLEFRLPLVLSGLATADVLILAGDIETKPSQWAQVLHALRSAYAGPVLFVLGNHEFYRGTFPDDTAAYRAAIAQDPQAFLLERASLVIEGVRFLGTTLWTDFAEGWDAAACARYMADFAVITDGALMTELRPNTIYRYYQESVDWLETQFTEPFAGHTVVVTHHAPSLGSQHPRFAKSPISGGFCSNLDAHIKRWTPAVWIHGHVHDPWDYTVGKTRILCNPWGYPEEGLPRAYQIVEV